MVDTLAPKKIFTQRELDTKLTPIGEQVLRSRARPKLLDTTPVFGTESSLLDRQAKSDKNKAQAMMSPVEEQEQNVKSSQETLDTKQTGERVKEDTPQGLVMKPIAYAAKGMEDKEIAGPIIVGEGGPEMIVPTGDGKISILPTKVVEGIMTKISDDSGVDLSKDTVSKFKNEDGTNRAAITGNDEISDPKIGSTETLMLLEKLEDQGVDTTDKDLRKSIMDYIKGADNTYYDELLNPPKVEIIPEKKVQTLMSQPIRKAEKGAEDIKIGSSRPMPSGPPPNTEPEPEEFDFNKLTYGKNRIDITYFYDNLDEIARHGFKQRFGQELEPNPKQLRAAKNEAMAKLTAIISMRIDKVDREILDNKREEYIKPDPYDPSGKGKQELFDEYGPEILPEA